jgi:uncharacterized protein (DUF1697 family)
MARHVLLLRGINLPRHKRVSMPQLREALASAGFEDVSTYVQSGNVVLSSGAGPLAVAQECTRVLKGTFGHDVDVLVRTREELAEIVRRNPLGAVATDPRRYLVTFLSAEPEPRVVEQLVAAAAAPERLVVSGRELYSWHPLGSARMPLWQRLARGKLGTTATSRNWQTVSALAELSR